MSSIFKLAYFLVLEDLKDYEVKNELSYGTQTTSNFLGGNEVEGFN